MSTEVDPETNPFGSGVDNPGADEDIEQIEMENRNTDTSTRSRSSRSTVISAQNETSFGGDISDTTPLIEKESKSDDTWDRIKRKFPKINPANSPFTARVDEYGRDMVRLNRDSGK